MSGHSSSLHNVLNMVLIASVIAVSSMYLELRYRYTELQFSCLGERTLQASYGESRVDSCPIACSDYCRNMAKTEQGLLYTPSEILATSKSDLNHAETVVSTEKLTSEKILASDPSAFKTSETIVTYSSLKFGESHIAPSASNLIQTSFLDFQESNAGFEITSMLNLEDEALRVSEHSIDVHNNPSYNPIPSQDSLEKLSQPEFLMNMFTSHSLETVLSTNTENHVKELEPVSKEMFMPPTALPFLQTSSMCVPTETPKEQKLSFHGELYDTTHLNAIDFQSSEIIFTQGIQTEAFNNFALDEDFLDDEDYNFADYDVEMSLEMETQRRIQTKLLKETADVTTLHGLRSHGTTMRCEGDKQSEFCHFQNLCFNTKEKDFVFLIGGESLTERHSFSAALDEPNHFTINLSSVPDHNAHSFPLVFIPAESISHLNVAVINEAAFIMSRFKPDNLMHVLHDDLLPLIHTLYKHRLLEWNRKADLRFVLADSFDPGDNALLYSSIFSHTPIWLFNPNETVNFVCFKDSYTGLSRGTLWYQYGFFKPQGSLVNNFSQVQRNVQRALDHLANIFHSPCLFCNNGNYLVFMSRKDNRLILNEGALVMGLVQTTKLKVMSVSVETHSISNIISILKNSKGLIGMHGSLLVFGIFLPPGSIFIELFPYAVNPSKYTPFKTFCEFPGSGIVYKSWRNTDHSKTVGHPLRPPDLGGIHHLSQKLQAKILAQTEVPDHLCCEDPSWLYHIYQDTEVDVDYVVATTTAALSEAASVDEGKNQRESYVEEEQASANKINSNDIKKSLLEVDDCEKHENNHLCGDENQENDSLKWLRKDFGFKPSKVRLLSCQVDTTSSVGDRIPNDFTVFQVTWVQPWNLDFVIFSKVNYEIVYQAKNDTSGKSVKLPYGVMDYLVLSETLWAEYLVWVRAVIDDSLAGPYHFISCQPPDR